MSQMGCSCQAGFDGVDSAFGCDKRLMRSTKSETLIETIKSKKKRNYGKNQTPNDVLSAWRVISNALAGLSIGNRSNIRN